MVASVECCNLIPRLTCKLKTGKLKSSTDLFKVPTVYFGASQHPLMFLVLLQAPMLTDKNKKAV